jgi:hypothetical protein
MPSRCSFAYGSCQELQLCRYHNVYADLADGSVHHGLGASCAAETEHQPMSMPLGYEGLAAELTDDGQLCVGNKDVAAALLRHMIDRPGRQCSADQDRVLGPELARNGAPKHPRHSCGKGTLVRAGPHALLAECEPTPRQRAAPSVLAWPFVSALGPSEPHRWRVPRPRLLLTPSAMARAGLTALCCPSAPTAVTACGAMQVISALFAHHHLLSTRLMHGLKTAAW